MRISLCLILITTLSFDLKCQLTSATDSLSFWGDAMISFHSDDHKEMALVHFNDCFKREVIAPTDSSKLNFHPAIVKIQSSDKSLRIYSWRIEFRDKAPQYAMCIFYQNNPPKIIYSRERNLNRINYEEMGIEGWYGALYYHILPQKFDDYYLLFGFAFDKNGFKHKFIEPFRIQEDRILFGKKTFLKLSAHNAEDWYHRIVLHYSPSANVAINFDSEKKQIIYDHISQFTDPRSGESLNVPDGTLEALYFKNDHWLHEPYLKNEILESAPLEKPILGKDSPGLDLFGKPKK